jgi:hypothetical protein
MASDAPAIEFTDYMGDLDDLHETNLIGPFESEAARNAEWERLNSLPPGAPEYNGGASFSYFPMKYAGPRDRIVAPEGVAGAATLQDFFAAFFGWEEN